MKAFSNIEYNSIENVIFSKKQHELFNDVRQCKMSLQYNRTKIEGLLKKKTQRELVINVSNNVIML